MIALVIATRNDHKVGEIRAILGERLCYFTLAEFRNAPETNEDARTFAGNATKKAVELARWLSNLPSSGGGLLPRKWEECQGRQRFVLADDSGLEVDALAGAPGVYSARFAALDSGINANSSAADNNAKLLRLLEGVAPEKRTARFRCVVALTPIVESGSNAASPVCYADEFELSTELFEGVCEGRIGFGPRGDGGFGYDPLFFPTNYDQTFAELTGEVKNQLSHRGKALEKLRHRFAALG